MCNNLTLGNGTGISTQWRRSIVKYGGEGHRSSHETFRLHPTSVISKHSTIAVPDSLKAPRKISFTFHFWRKSFIPDGVKLAELSNNSFE